MRIFPSIKCLENNLKRASLNGTMFVLLNQKFKEIEMTLVPIIYTSLIIFSSLLFFVIIISYIAYKTSSKNRRNLLLERIAMSKSETIAIQTPVSDAIRKMNDYHIQSVNVIKSNDQVRSDESKVINSKTIAIKKKSSLTEKERNNISRYNGKPSLRSTRLKIMNESKKFRTSINENELERNHTHEIMIESNVLNYYDNTPENDYVRMDTQLIRKAQ